MKYGEQVHITYNGKVLNGRYVKPFSSRMSEVMVRGMGTYYTPNENVKPGHVPIEQQKEASTNQVHPLTGRSYDDLGIQ